MALNYHYCFIVVCHGYDNPYSIIFSTFSKATEILVFFLLLVRRLLNIFFHKIHKQQWAKIF